MPGLIETLMGTNVSLTDKDIASDMLKDSKFSVTSVARAATESTNPQVREIVSRQLNACVNMHYQLSDLMIRKDWYPAYDSPGHQLQSQMKEAQRLT